MNNIGIIIVLLILLAGGYYFVAGEGDTADTSAVVDVTSSENEDEMEDKMEDKEEMMDDEMMDKDEEEMMDKDESTDVDAGVEVEAAGNTVSVNARGTFETYSPSQVSQAEGTVVLGFFADWCPSCRALKGDIEANAGDIPSGLTILDVDYDNSTELKQKYGVTTQHTLVEVDSNGNLVQKWSGGNTLASVLAKVN